MQQLLPLTFHVRSKKKSKGSESGVSELSYKSFEKSIRNQKKVHALKPISLSFYKDSVTGSLITKMYFMNTHTLKFIIDNHDKETQYTSLTELPHSSDILVAFYTGMNIGYYGSGPNYFAKMICDCFKLHDIDVLFKNVQKLISNFKEETIYTINFLDKELLNKIYNNNLALHVNDFSKLKLSKTDYNNVKDNKYDVTNLIKIFNKDNEFMLRKIVKTLVQEEREIKVNKKDKSIFILNEVINNNKTIFVDYTLLLKYSKQISERHYNLIKKYQENNINILQCYDIKDIHNINDKDGVINKITYYYYPN